MNGAETSDGVSKVLAETGWMIQPPILPKAGQPRRLIDSEGIQTRAVVLGGFFVREEAFAQGTRLPSHDTGHVLLLLAFTVKQPVQVGGRRLWLFFMWYSAIA